MTLELHPKSESGEQQMPAPVLALPRMSAKEVYEAAARHGYACPAYAAQAVASMLRRRISKAGARACLVEGPPGAGKTALAEVTSQFLDAEYVYYLCHSWTGADDLFVGVDVAAAVAGEAKRVRQPGALLKAAKGTAKGPVVLVIDELDKAPERAENLLLDFLQDGKVPVKPGVHLRANLDMLLVFITSNATRIIGEPLKRRVRRFTLATLPAKAQAQIAMARIPQASQILCEMLAGIADTLAKADGTSPTVQELVLVIDEIGNLPSIDLVSVKCAISGWLCRTEVSRAHFHNATTGNNNMVDTVNKILAEAGRLRAALESSK